MYVLRIFVLIPVIRSYKRHCYVQIRGDDLCLDMFVNRNVITNWKLQLHILFHLTRVVHMRRGFQTWRQTDIVTWAHIMFLGISVPISYKRLCFVQIRHHKTDIKETFIYSEIFFWLDINLGLFIALHSYWFFALKFKTALLFMT